MTARNRSCCLPRNESDGGLSESHSGSVPSALASVLIFTIVVDILGNVLVILSVYRNKKLRNAGEVRFYFIFLRVKAGTHHQW